MTRPVAVLRPDPGNARTVARMQAAGLVAIRLPLFAVVPVAWEVPDTGTHDAVMLTSANAIRHAGAGLAQLRALPVLAVGEATAATARDAGFTVALTGAGDAADLVKASAQAGFARILHLTGRDHRSVCATTAVVYASDPLPISRRAIQTLPGSIALLHSTRAATRLNELLQLYGIDRSRIGLATISAAVLAAAGPGWGRSLVAGRPTDAAILAIARTLAD